MKIKEILIIIGLITGFFILGKVSKTCIKCPEQKICLPCDSEEEIKNELIIKDLKDEIHNIHISNDRRTRDSLRAIYNP